jgi:hypothetical protein
MAHLNMAQLEQGLDEIRRAPRDRGVLRMVVRRPAIGAREVLAAGELDAAVGLVGDNWSTRGSRRTAAGQAHPLMQINVMGARAIALIAGDEARWPLAGDQLFVDLDLSEEALPAGSRLRIGDAVLEVTTEPHTGCDKFVSRFGVDAMKFVNSPTGRKLRLRGLNARVVEPGAVRPGDTVVRLPAGPE